VSSSSTHLTQLTYLPRVPSAILRNYGTLGSGTYSFCSFLQTALQPCTTTTAIGISEILNEKVRCMNCVPRAEYCKTESFINYIYSVFICTEFSQGQSKKIQNTRENSPPTVHTPLVSWTPIKQHQQKMQTFRTIVHIFETDVDVCEVDNEASHSLQQISTSDKLLLYTPPRFRYKCKVSDNRCNENTP
jgi:hypothetical protein